MCEVSSSDGNSSKCKSKILRSPQQNTIPKKRKLTSPSTLAICEDDDRDSDRQNWC